MNQEISVLLITAASLGFIHTILGPDHYLPFIVMSAAGKWSKMKTLWVTILSGVGHVLSSVVLGFVGIGFGAALHKVVAIESSRGEIASWLMIAFGLVYFVLGMRRAMKKKKHYHLHDHLVEGNEVHEDQHKIENLTPWIIFTIFIFGPCEVLIPLLMYPAAKQSTIGLVLVTSVFGVTTILTMVAIVMLGGFGFNTISFGKMEKYSHALAGLFIFLSGSAIQFLGL